MGFEDIFAALKSELVHYLLFSNRELLAGSRYRPKNDWENWGAQEGSVYVAGERLKVRKPRFRHKGRETVLPIYEALSDRSRFSQEVLLKEKLHEKKSACVEFFNRSAADSRV